MTKDEIEIKTISGLDPEKIYIFEMRTDGISAQTVHIRCKAFSRVMKEVGIKGVVIPEGDLKSIRGEDD